MITVSGRTFEHRDILKRYRGEWSNATKQWTFNRLHPDHIAILRKLPGVLVTESDREPISFETREPSDEPHYERSIESISEIARRALEPSIKPSHRTGPTGVYGDDDRFLNHFLDQNPTAFFGFSSLQAFTDYVDALPQPVTPSRRRAWEVSTHYSKWSATRSMREALTLARDGWSEGLEGLTDLDVPHALAKRRLAAVAGGTVNVGRMLSGDPRHMVRRPRQPGRKVMTLFVETFMSAGVSPENAIIRARLVAAMADALERQGYSCEIIAIVTTRDYNSRTGHQCAIALKSAGERINLLDIIFALGHPSFFRRMIFAVVGAADECRSTWESQGSPATAFNTITHPTARNEFYIKQLALMSQELIDDDDPLSMLRFIKPDTLDI